MLHSTLSTWNMYCTLANCASRSRSVSILADTVTLEHAHTPARARAADRVWSRALMFAAAAIVVVAPFERPLFTVGGGLTVTTSEAATSIALVVAALYVAARRQIVWPAPLMLSGSAFVAAMVVAALTAPMEQGNALRFAARMIVAAFVCVLFVNVGTTTQRARAIVRVALGIAALVGAIAVLEQANPAVLAGLTAFRPGFHVVAGQMRPPAR